MPDDRDVTTHDDTAADDAERGHWATICAALRRFIREAAPGWHAAPYLAEAADHIEALAAENAELRATLERVEAVRRALDGRYQGSGLAMQEADHEHDAPRAWLHQGEVDAYDAARGLLRAALRAPDSDEP